MPTFGWFTRWTIAAASRAVTGPPVPVKAGVAPATVAPASGTQAEVLKGSAFLDGAPAFNDDHVAVFDDVIGYLIEEIEARALAEEGKAVVWIDGGLHASEVLGAQQLIETTYQLGRALVPTITLEEVNRVARDVIEHFFKR